MRSIAPISSWTRHWDPSSEHYFYYERSTGQTRWARPEIPAEVFDSPLAPQRSADDTMLEGVVLQQTRGDDLNPWPANAQQHHHHQEEALVHRRRQPDGHPKLRKRGASKGRPKIIYTDAPLKVESGITDEEPRKDYIGLAREYSITAPFRDTSGEQTCVICQNRKASGVFFPCEHKCACRRCIEQGGFGRPGAVSKGGSLCPVCCQQVVFVAPCTGGKKETELYWRWVEEVKPQLPRDFRHKFHTAAILLKIKAEPDSHKTWDRPPTPECCTVS